MLHALLARLGSKVRGRRLGVPAWARCLALVALMFATPITQQALTEVVSLLAHDDCGCDDDCKEHGECPGPCQTCFCCPHSNVVTHAAFDVPTGTRVLQSFELTPEDGGADGYRTPLFRPPTC